MLRQAERFTQEASKTVANDRVAHFARDRETHPAMGQTIQAAEDRDPTITDRATAIVYLAKVKRAAKVLAFSQTKRLLGIRHGIGIIQPSHSPDDRVAGAEGTPKPRLNPPDPNRGFGVPQPLPPISPVFFSRLLSAPGRSGARVLRI